MNYYYKTSILILIKCSQVNYSEVYLKERLNTNTYVTKEKRDGEKQRPYKRNY